ncbi:hypothetical protein NQ317_007789 [Molorchus minor]|uniref:DUF229 domain containing protein n=1 Tax=Molorchus minor TaxID=1323400 RepID=A0ABQ9IXB4_9CUCU|nr:hypothetical protein NQ317_007789 [Molorchus minor]
MIYSYKIIIGAMVVFNVAYLTYNVTISFKDDPQTATTDFFDDKQYIIDTPGCRIENVDAFSEEIRNFIYKFDKVTCADSEPLTYVSRSGENVTLNINNSLLNTYSRFTVSCCYSTITRNHLAPNPDDDITFSDCTYFNDSVLISENFVFVKCTNFYHTVYENVHATLQAPQDYSNINAPNILLIGIDGVSRSNLIRTMPKTFEYCEKNRWVNLKGYNKIADNTFPNLMAVLTGMNFSQTSHVCNPYERGKLDNCSHFIWKVFKEYGYSTAYAEDTPTIATFNGIKTGFIHPPTDYYFRPYFLAANQLSAKYLCLRAHCTGSEKTGIRMQNLIKTFLSTTKDRTPAFGLFWMNAFSHEDVNCPSSMDDDFLEYFQELQKDGHLEDTIVIFFSDHGFRFGNIRLTHTGWMEERLPFIYVWIPEKFRLAHQEEYKHLQQNSERLTTPYDLYMTLQHILHLSNNSFVQSPSQGCLECQSLLKPVPLSRTCSQCGIPQAYCTCSTYEQINKNEPIVLEASKYFIGRLNEKVQSYGNASRGCSVYFLNKVSHARSLVIKSKSEQNVMVVVETNPEAIFEATVKVTYDKYYNSTFSLLEVNRLDRYAPKTFCVKDSPVQIYCYCKSLLKQLTNIFCNNKFYYLNNKLTSELRRGQCVVLH